jgi:hypothetical protein
MGKNNVDIDHISMIYIILYVLKNYLQWFFKTKPTAETVGFVLKLGSIFQLKNQLIPNGV